MTRIHDGERGFKDHCLEGSSRRIPGTCAGCRTPRRSWPPMPRGRAGCRSSSAAARGITPRSRASWGPGLCHGAVVGDVFTSPSAIQVWRAIEALDGGAGVLLAFGNYSGDVMNFGLAAEQARAGRPARCGVRDSGPWAGSWTSVSHPLGCPMRRMSAPPSSRPCR
jgi:dihydroxyacetone kinase